MMKPEETRPRRGLGLADVLILFAASAVALSWMRKPLEYRLTFISDGRIIDNVRPATLVGAAFAVTWGLGVLAIRLRLARHGSRGWTRRPGFVACATATLAAVIKLAALLIWG